MIKSVNLTTGAELFFDEHSTPEWAVAYGHFVESENKASWFFAETINAANEKRTPEWMKSVKKGKHSVMCGEWSALLNEK